MTNYDTGRERCLERGLEYKRGGFLTHIDGKPVGPPDPAILKTQYPTWGTKVERAGSLERRALAALRKAEQALGQARTEVGTTKAPTKPASPPAPPKPPKPAIPDSLELFRRGQELYTVIPETRVDDDARRAARAMVKACRAALGYEFGPDVLWVAARGDPAWVPPASGLGQVPGPIDRLGWFDPARQPNVVHVRAGLTPEETAAIVAHEWGHYAQWKQQGGVGMEVCYRHDPDPYEEDAHEFMYKMMAQFQGDWS